jgi:hypothetical protein
LGRWRAAAASLGGEVSTASGAWAPGAGTTLRARVGGAVVVVDTRVDRPDGDDGAPRLVTRVRGEVADAHHLGLALHRAQVPSFARYFRRVEDLDPRIGERYILRATDAVDAARRFSGEVAGWVADLAPVEVTRDERWATVTLRGVVDSARALEVAARIAYAVGRPGVSGPYR